MFAFLLALIHFTQVLGTKLQRVKNCKEKRKKNKRVKSGDNAMKLLTLVLKHEK